MTTNFPMIQARALKPAWSFILLFLVGTSVGQIHIEATIAGHSGEEAILYSFDDLLTRKPNYLDTVIIDGNNQCVIDATWQQTGLLCLRFGQTATFFYGRENDSLKLRIDIPDTANSIRSGRITYVDPVFIVGGINSRIIVLEDSINNFLSRYYVAILRKRARKSTGRFVDRMMLQFGEDTDTYFNDYLLYSMALLRLNAYHNKDSLYAQYLRDRPMLYNNDAWMAFFTQFYAGVLDKLAYDVTVGDEMKDAVMKGERSKLADLMNRLPWLDNGQIREFVILTEIYRTFSKKIYPQKSMLQLLRSTRDESIISQHRQIAANAIDKLLFMKEGSTMPVLSCFTTKNRSQYYVPDKDKYTYYTFWSASNSISVSDVEVVEKLEERYRKWINFVYVCTDEDGDDWHSWINNGKHKGKHLQAKHPEKMMETVNIKTLPAHYLVAPGAKILYTPELAVPEHFQKAAQKIINGEMTPTWLWRQ